MKKALLYVSLLFLCACSSGIRNHAEKRAESAIKEWMKERADKKKNMPLTDFSIKKERVVINNDSICSILFELSVTTTSKGKEKRQVSYTMVKDKAMTKLEGKDVFKELIDYKESYVVNEERIKRDMRFFNPDTLNKDPKMERLAEHFAYDMVYIKVLDDGNPVP